MNRKLSLLVLCSACLITFALGCTSAEVSLSPLAATYSNKRIAVVDITDPHKRRVRWTIGIAGEVNHRKYDETQQQYEKALIDIGHYQVLNLSKQIDGASENAVAFSPITDAGTAIELARKKGLDGVVVIQSGGEFSWATLFVEDRYRASAKLIDVSSGQIVWSADGSYTVSTILPIPLTRSYSKVAHASIAEAIADELKKKLGPGRLIIPARSK